MNGSSSRLRSVPGAILWRVELDITADRRVAERCFEIAKAVHEDPGNTAAAMRAVFAQEGLDMVEASLSVAEPDMNTATSTATTASSTAAATTAAPARAGPRRR
ncbi:unnamed protein product [Prorocentrum cordatum]|uniref:Uncharacterized protein n=1 Tax=Prorocentrum cordatum TaxID=2364126 RepID=A0ABN9WRC4_9DINO|nr:unnamed protein product [Polarella glacialis]